MKLTRTVRLSSFPSLASNIHKYDRPLPYLHVSTLPITKRKIFAFFKVPLSQKVEQRQSQIRVNSEQSPSNLFVDPSGVDTSMSVVRIHIKRDASASDHTVGKESRNVDFSWRRLKMHTIVALCTSFWGGQQSAMLMLILLLIFYNIVYTSCWIRFELRCDNCDCGFVERQRQA